MHHLHLRSRGKVTVNVIDLVLEPHIEQLITLIQNKHLDVFRAQVPSLDHVKHPTWCSRNDMLSVLQFTNILSDRRAS